MKLITFVLSWLIFSDSVAFGQGSQTGHVPEFILNMLKKNKAEFGSAVEGSFCKGLLGNGKDPMPIKSVSVVDVNLDGRDDYGIISKIPNERFRLEIYVSKGKTKFEPTVVFESKSPYPCIYQAFRVKLANEPGLTEHGYISINSKSLPRGSTSEITEKNEYRLKARLERNTGQPGVETKTGVVMKEADLDEEILFYCSEGYLFRKNKLVTITGCD